MLGVADRDGLTLGRRPVAAKTGTVQSRFPGENNDAWMAGFTPQLAASVWMGTDRNSPIRTATGDPISGRTLPGEVWRGFMATALSGAPAESFVPFRPLGTPPSDAAPNAAPTPTAHPATPPPSAAPPEPDPAPDGTEPLPDPADPAPDDESARDARGAHRALVPATPARTTTPRPRPPNRPRRRAARPQSPGRRPAGRRGAGPRVAGAHGRLISRGSRPRGPERLEHDRSGPAGRRGHAWPRSARRSARRRRRPTPPPRRAPCRT